MDKQALPYRNGQCRDAFSGFLRLRHNVLAGATAGGKVNNKTARGRPFSCGRNSSGGHVAGVHDRSTSAGMSSGSGATLPLRSQAHSSGSWSAASVAVLPHVVANARRTSASVPNVHSCAPRFHCAGCAAALVRHRKATTLLCAMAAGRRARDNGDGSEQVGGVATPIGTRRSSSGYVASGRTPPVHPIYVSVSAVVGHTFRVGFLYDRCTHWWGPARFCRLRYHYAAILPKNLIGDFQEESLPPHKVQTQ